MCIRDSNRCKITSSVAILPILPKIALMDFFFVFYQFPCSNSHSHYTMSFPMQHWVTSFLHRVHQQHFLLRLNDANGQSSLIVSCCHVRFDFPVLFLPACGVEMTMVMGFPFGMGFPLGMGRNENAVMGMVWEWE